MALHSVLLIYDIQELTGYIGKNIGVVSCCLLQVLNPLLPFWAGCYPSLILFNPQMRKRRIDMSMPFPRAVNLKKSVEWINRKRSDNSKKTNKFNFPNNFLIIYIFKSTYLVHSISPILSGISTYFPGSASPQYFSVRLNSSYRIDISSGIISSSEGSRSDNPGPYPFRLAAIQVYYFI